MVTLILAWMNSKYDTGYTLLFVAGFFIDLASIDAVIELAK